MAYDSGRLSVEVIEGKATRHKGGGWASRVEYLWHRIFMAHDRLTFAIMNAMFMITDLLPVSQEKGGDVTRLAILSKNRLSSL